MWVYEKKLQYPVRIKHSDARAAKVIISQFGGADGELAAAMRYFSQRYAMPTSQLKGLLTDIATEELAHLEMVGAILYQLTKDLSVDEIKREGFDTYFVDHTAGLYLQGASGMPFTAAYYQSKGDAITDLHEDMAAEQKARTTYDNILRLVDDPDIIDPIRFLRQREIVHFQRFGEAQQSIWNDYGGAADKPLEIRLFKTQSIPHYTDNPAFVWDKGGVDALFY